MHVLLALVWDESCGNVVCLPPSPALLLKLLITRVASSVHLLDRNSNIIQLIKPWKHFQHLNAVIWYGTDWIFSQIQSLKGSELCQVLQLLWQCRYTVTTEIELA